MSQSQQPIIVKNTKSYLAINKPPGWLSQSGRNSDISILEYYQSKNPGKLHLLNRIDRPVSGMVLLSKTRAFTKSFVEAQNNNLVSKTYLAVVEGKVEVENNELEHWLVHDKRQMCSYITDQNNQHAKKCTLSFKRLGLFDRYSLLEITIRKGKFHQIRAQLSFYGHPIKGDVKYGARRGNRDRSIHLHSHKLKFENPVSETIQFTAPIWTGDSLWEAATGMLV
ncbi:MAG: RNA pseudouridine synthase [Saprospiraceae bacterium]|nr:RNA pseudouridine synthase [Bacteroidia bacterium]NNF20960.1 RNA pseudouridine synthase [Saprospiraceae bacterium]